MSGSTAFHRLVVGDEVPSLVRGPLTTAHIMRWSAAIENWHRIHYDQRFAVDHDGLPDILVNGSWKQHLLIEMLTGFAGADAWLWKLAFEYRRVNVCGDVLTAWGTVTGKRSLDGMGLVDLAIGIRDQNGAESTPGIATVAMPTMVAPIPYPFGIGMTGVAQRVSS